MIYKNILETIGKTPLVELNKLEKQINAKAKIYAKVESFNPSGSVKDRAAYKMIEFALKEGLIDLNTTLIEETSGNTGIALSMIAAYFGMKLIIVMPSSMSVERIKMMEAYGTEVVLSDASLGMQGAKDKALELKHNIENSFIISQFENHANSLAHYINTGKEIYDDTNGEIDILVSGIGTGGTISGTAKFLKNKKDIKVIGVEPASSPLISKGKSASHKIQGIGANFIPDILDLNVIDEIQTVSDDDAFKEMRNIAKTEGIFVGISSGAALSIAIKEAIKKENEGKAIVVILPDSGNRYLSIL